MFETFAPAKINLYLHVTGQRQDGYHFLDSLVAFASVGDFLRFDPSGPFRFSMDGPMAKGLGDEDPQNNLVVRAALALAAALGKPLTGHLILTKNLPIASGIGGGSTDAAAALRLLAAHWKMPPDAPLLASLAKGLGQDVPCCLAAQSCCFQGIGDVTVPAPLLPTTPVLLVNPGRALATPCVFKGRHGPFSSAAPLTSAPQTVEDLAALLSERTNDLTESACSLCPEIAEVLKALAAQPGCLLARMSGSGATCFGLFPDRAAVRDAAARLYQAHDTWWVAPAFLPAFLDPLPLR